jgi:hypothetical protein
MQATLKAPIINKTDEQVQAEQDSADTALKALEQRYANPNWFNIAAAFFKPQLGGFGASLGSASQELGNWQEQQRANELPIYAARAQVGALKGQLKNRNDAAKEFEKAKAEGFSPDKLAALQARLSSLGANDLADSVNKMLEAQQKERSMSASEYSNAMSAANALYTAGNLTKAGLAAKVNEIQSQYGPKPRGAAAPAEVKVDAGAATAPVAAAEPEGQMGFVVGPGFKSADAGRLDSLSPELRDAYARLAAGDPSAAKDVESIVKTGAQIGAVPSTSAPKFIPAQVPAKPAQTYESAGAQGDSATALTKEELKNINDAYGPKITNIIANDPRVTETRSANFYRAGTLLNNPEVQAGMGQLFKEKGFAAAFKTALKEGINLAVAAPTGGWNAAISAPVDKILTAYDVNPKARQALVELNRIAMEDAITDIREGTRALGGGHTSTSEYESMMTRIANTNEPYKLMQQFFAKRAVENDFNAKAHDLWVNYTNAPGFATKPVGNFFSSPEYKKLSKEHSKNLIKAASVAD